MENIDLLPTTGDNKERIESFTRQYARHGGIYFKVLSVDEDKKEIEIRVLQKRNPQRKYLEAKDLIKRAKDLLKGEVPEEFKIHARPIVYKPHQLDVVDAEWIKSKMDFYDLKSVDLVDLFGIDKTTISRLLNEDRELTQFQRVAFFYFFKSIGKAKGLKK